MKELKLEIELLEERIAPGVAPGLNGPGADAPPGASTSIFDPGEGEIAGPIWFGRISGQF